MEGDDLPRTREVLEMDWLPDTPAPDAAVLLRPGQFWARSLCGERSFYQIFSIEPTGDIQYLPWTDKDGYTLVSHNNVQHLAGAGTSHIAPFSTLFPAEAEFALLIVGRENYAKDGSNLVAVHRILPRTPGLLDWDTYPSPATPDWKQWLQVPQPCRLYSEATLTKSS